ERPETPPRPSTVIPFVRDVDFVERREILDQLWTICAAPGSRAALVGLGGVGKSQLAIEYAHWTRERSPDTWVFWVHASTRARFEEAYRDIADRLKLPGRKDPKINILKLVKDWLYNESNGRWMIVLDNVDDIEVFYPKPKSGRDDDDKGVAASLAASLAVFLPQSDNGSIVVTSRNRDAAVRLVGSSRRVIEVQAMDKDQAVQLLRNKLEDASDEGGMADLVDALDRIPLAISQAAAYINRRARMTILGYLKEFRANDKKKESLLNRDAGDIRRDESASNSVVMTWQISFEHIRQKRQSATDLLSLMSFFNPQGIPESVLRRYCRNTAEPGGEDEANDAFDEDFDTLRVYSLIAATVETDVCEMHALVKFCTQVWLSSFSDAERWKERFVGLMSQEFPTGEFENWDKCRLLLPHVESLYNMELSSRNSVKEWVQVLNDAGRYIETAQAKYSDAERLSRRALHECEKKLGEQHLSTLTSMFHLASVLWNRGKYSEAEALNRRALEGREKELGVQHLSTLTNMNNLALVLQYQGKYLEAEALNRRALEGYEKGLGVQHPNTLMSVSNLALVLQYQGKYSEAEALNRRALEGYEKELGVQHPDTLTSVSNLALVLRYHGKYSEAEALNRRALEGREKELGVQHPDTLTSVSGLASVLQYQGKYSEAEALNRRALEGYEKGLGVQHPYTLTSMNNLALVLRYQGKYSEAEALNRRALEGSEKELGVQHPDTLTSVYCLAYLLQKRRRYEEASQLYQRACNGYSQKLGSQHPTAIACRGHFKAMQQEAKHKRGGQGRALADDETELQEKATSGIANPTGSEAMPWPARGTSKSKDSFYARFMSKMRRKDL
ncbi:hypothetical protein GQ44DRAFT_637109, partial [Phaeosphaeriaceae sp. PMI808]